jgi:hypothetical protein
MAAAEPQAFALNDLRPATLGDDALELRDRLLVCYTVAGDNVGNDAFGI